MYLLYQEGFVLDAMARCFGIQLLAVNISLFFFFAKGPAAPPLRLQQWTKIQVDHCNWLVQLLGSLWASPGPIPL